mgnify:CR=1 FL=1
MKYILPASLLLIFVASVVIVKKTDAFSFNIEFNQNEKIVGLDKQQQNLSRAIQNLQNDTVKFNESASEISNALISLLDGKTKQQQDLQNIISDLQRDTLKFNASISEISETLLRSLDDKVIGNQKAAESALKLAENALLRKDYEFAEVYILSAINHRPSEIKYINKYYEHFIVKNETPPNIDKLQRFSDILDVAIYQVNPDNIAEVLKIKEAIEKKQRDILESETPQLSQMGKDIDKDFNNVISGELSIDNISKKSDITKALLERILSINELLSSDTVHPDRLPILNEELEYTKSLYSASVALDSATTVFTKIDKLIPNENSANDNNAKLAKSQINTAISFLPQIWTIDTARISVLDTKAHSLLGKLGEKEKTANKILSKKPIAEIEKILVAVKEIAVDDIKSKTALIENVKEESKKIDMLLAEIQDKNLYYNTRDNTLKEVSEIIKKLELDRTKKYQKWAVGEIAKANQLCDEKDYDSAFKYLKPIDTTLPLSNVYSLYNSVFEKCANNSKKRDEMTLEKAETEKFKTLAEVDEEL